jgi:hypothetical protein
VSDIRAKGKEEDEMRRAVVGGIVTLGVLILGVSGFPGTQSRFAVECAQGACIANRVMSPKSSRLYKHPTLDFQFSASEGWVQQPRPEDDLIYEVSDPGTGIHVVLWYTTTEQSGSRYLMKMADMKGFPVKQEPRRRTIDDLGAWALNVPGKIRQANVQTTLAVIPCGKSKQHSRENALFIVQIWCPVFDHDHLAGEIESLLNSVRITSRVNYRGEEWTVYPETFEIRPDLPSPFTTDDGREFVVAHTKDGESAIVPVTVANGAPLDYNKNQWNKGRQLVVDDIDFPTLARTGLHSETELGQTITITGLPVAEITAEGRPGESSGTGFMAADEDIVSVLRGDNRLVARLGFTHPELARPLFQVFNVAVRNLETYRRKHTPVNDIEYILYNGHRVYLDFYGSKGWQESIFDDDVQGYWQMRMWRELEAEEELYLRQAYGHLGEDMLSNLTKNLTTIFTGEMVPFYIMRYGFYEGHTDYRADPISIASVFGLMSIPEIDSALGGNLHEWFDHHYAP